MKNILNLTFLIVAFSAVSQNYSYTPKWKKGDKYSVTSITDQTKWKKGVIDEEEHTEMEANLKIRSVSKSNYIIEVTYENFILNSYGKVYDKLGEEEKVNSILKLKYKVSKDGKTCDLMNWEEARDVVFGVNQDVLNKITEASDSSSSNKSEDIKSILSPLMSLFDNKETIESYFKNEIQAFISPYQSEYNKKDTVVNVVVVKNPIGKQKDSLSTTVRNWVVSTNKKAKTISLASSEEMDMKAFEEMMRDMMTKMMNMFSKVGQKDGEEISEERKAKLEKKKAKQKEMLDNMHFEITKSSQIEYNTKLKHVTKYVTNGSVIANTVGKNSKSETRVVLEFKKI